MIHVEINAHDINTKKLLKNKPKKIKTHKDTANQNQAFAFFCFDKWTP